VVWKSSNKQRHLPQKTAPFNLQGHPRVHPQPETKPKIHKNRSKNHTTMFFLISKRKERKTRKSSQIIQNYHEQTCCIYSTNKNQPAL